MRRYLLLLIALLALSNARAQYYSINFDEETVAKMAAAFNTEAVAEAYYAEQIANIRDHYETAELAAAGIFSSKFLDRKALTDLGLWTSSTENYYYRRIYTMVSARIMPKIWTVAGMMIRYPQNALYWGSYLYKVCQETKNLCYQFESIVTNSRLSFQDIAFLEINQELASILKLSELADADWNTLLDNLSNIGGNFSKEDLQKDIDNLYSRGVNLAGAGVRNMVGAITGSSSFDGSIIEKALSVAEIADNVYTLYDGLTTNTGATLLSFIGGEEGLANLFDLSGYNSTSWLTDYAREEMGQYYTQRWYIYRLTNNTNAGSTDPDNNMLVIYEDVFDSYSMDLSTFRAGLNARLSEYNNNDDGIRFYLGSDSKRYYQATNAQKIAGCETATISITCHDGAKLGEGTTQYKCNSCGGSVNAHTKECVMATSVPESDIDTSELERMISDFESQINDLQSQIDALEAENEELVSLISESDITEVVALRQQFNRNRDQISSLKSEKRDLERQLDEYLDAKNEAESGEATATDDYYRIPAIMQDCKTAYSLRWNGSGSWEGNTFVRTATMPNINGTITFKATVSIARRPKYFLGIKIHRAIVQISWELTTEYSDTQVIAVMNLDPNKSDAEKADEVNQKLTEIARDYPNCEPSVEYARSVPVESDDTDDTYHLLWSSDRLEIARDIDTRITKIYSDLVSLEKMMTYRHSFIDMLLAAAPYINDEQGRRLNIIERSRRRWLRSAANSSHSDGYNGKYDDDED